MTSTNVRTGNLMGTDTAERQKDDATWLAADWVELKELDEAEPRLNTDGWPCRARVESGRLVVEAYCVQRWHTGDEHALYCDDFKTDDPPVGWRGSAEETLAALDTATRNGHDTIRHDPAEAPNPAPALRWNSRMRNEEEYVRKNPDTGDAIVNDRNEASVDEERLEMDAREAAAYSGPPIPDGTDMDAVVEAGYDGIAIRTRRGNLWELCSAGGIILWDDYRAS